jgi:predicted oxidoreductase (fatty acid repression mutant protein)
MNKDFYEAITKRRSYYSIGKEKTIAEEEVENIVKTAIKHTPSSFNSQSSRVLLLLNEHHDKFWEIVKSTIKKIVPPEAYEKSAEKIDNCFKSGWGTVLYFEDTKTIESFQKEYPLYKENFPIWSNQSSGMLQYVIWTALELEGLGATLQHYNPIIDEEVKKVWKIPGEYKLIAQMPFGKPLANPEPKDFKPIEQRFKICK